MTIKSESEVQNEILLEASKKGWTLFRNNVGVAIDSRGVPIRYGLANVTKKMNQNLKSSDLIGIKPTLITPDMVGQTLGVFVAIEVKRSGWKKGSSKREEAQGKFINLVNNLGGLAKFCNNALELDLKERDNE